MFTQAGRVRGEDGAHRGEDGVELGLLRIGLSGDVLVDLLPKSSNERGHLLGVLGLHVVILRLGEGGLQLHVELGGQLVPEGGHRVADFRDDEIERRECCEHFLHLGLGVTHVAVEDELERLARLAEGLQGRFLGSGRLVICEVSFEGKDLLHLGGILELERREQVALVDNGARGERVRELARLGGADGDEHLHRLGLGERLACLHFGAVVD
mmetsp:Transcript_34370/g.42439  ORF Transcript_34370/g.42439 Transcript_34370/m.42439 type:complete len:212 (-) Transcript_34370:619-1254(-)